MTKIITYNVNGIRSAIDKGFIDWIKAVNPTIFCLQEVKAEPHQVDLKPFEELGYEYYWQSAQKKGYSGVATFTKIKPKEVVYGCGIEKYDNEGRVLTLVFENFTIINTYMPSGSSGEERQAFKFEWLKDFYGYAKQQLSNHNKLIIVGDYNICHKAIDIHNPKSNANTSGFLPEERAWMDEFVALGFIDSFRHVNPEPHNYTWWSYRAGARKRNLGWRIDYQMLSENMANDIESTKILSEAVHSDHCPVLLTLNI